MAEKFLQQVARYYCDPVRRGELHRLTFVFPNKRAGMFMKRYIQEHLSAPTFMPRFTTFSRLAEQFADRAAGLRRNQLFALYDSYRRVLASRGNPEQAKDFDRFVFWGDMILNDFDEIDRSLADPAKLYKNLHDLKEIASDYLTDEQKHIVRLLWGDSFITTGDVGRFWLHADPNPGDDSKGVAARFVQLWEVLGDIYNDFHKNLEKDGVTTAGRQYREAAARVKATAPDELNRRRYVFVGLSDVSVAETAIMERLRDVGAADFFWDIDSPLFRDKAGRIVREHTAANAIRRLSERFSAPADFEFDESSALPDISIIAVPSATAQAKAAGEILAKWYAEGAIDADNPADTAVVLPDERLLTPLLLGLPQQVQAINITMGLPYSATTFATLLKAVTLLHTRSRRRVMPDGSERRLFFYRDLQEVLAHPHVCLIAPEGAEAIREDIQRRRLYNVDASELAANHPELAFLFKPVADPMDVHAVCDYTAGMLRGLYEALDALPAARRTAPELPLEMEMLKLFGEYVEELRSLVVRYGVRMQEETFFALFESVFETAPINLSGTPLRGLQVMGVLETRVLDFDNIIMLSMNERTFPRRNYVRTMIPNNIRAGFGLRPIDHAESVYSYHFYHAIARARRVCLLYDSRSGDLGSGEMSRYLTQLIYLHPEAEVKRFAVELAARLPDHRVIEVAKTPEVLAELESFKRPGGRSLSASSLKDYMKCPLSFYLKYVKGYRAEAEITDYMDAAEYGSIFHKVAEELYKPFEGREVTAADINAMLSGTRLKELIDEQIAAQTKGAGTAEMTAEGILNSEQIESLMRLMLRYEMEQYCRPAFTYVKGEKLVKGQWQITPALKVNFKMYIDRVDRLADGTYRFIDYKTGVDSAHISGGPEALFEGKYNTMAVFQLLVYCEAWNDMEKSDSHIQPVLHRVRMIGPENGITPLTFGISRAKVPVEFPGCSGDFRPRLNALVEEIFNPDKPFTQTQDAHNCKFCPFLSMCGRTVPEDF